MKKTLTMMATCSLMALAAAALAADAAKTGGKPAEAPPASTPAGFNGGKGKVLETMDAANYTYVKVEIAGKPVWAAAPQFKVKKGQTVMVPAGSPMPGFHSKTLKRTFDMIYFVNAVEVEGGAKK